MMADSVSPTNWYSISKYALEECMGFQLIDPEGKQIPIGLSIRIGSNPACDIVLKGPDVSPYHVIIGMYPDGLLIRDEDSANGTFVNGERLEHVILLKQGDRVRVGTAEFTVQSDSASPAPQVSGAPEAKIPSPSGNETVRQAPVPANVSYTPVPEKKKSSGGCLRIGLTIILITLLACVILGGAGYILVKNGVIPKRMVDVVTGYSSSQVHIYNFTDKTVYVKDYEDNDEYTVNIPHIYVTLKPYESISEMSFTGTAEWNILTLGSEKDTDDLGHCRFWADQVYDYNIVILKDKVLIDDVRYPAFLDKLPSRGSDMILATSPICEPKK
jgi:hypothetical protein